MIPSDPLFQQQWHLRNTGQTGGTPGIDIDVLRAWDRYSGQGVTIAVADDGVDARHPDLAANYNATLSHDYESNGPAGTPVSAEDNHGTWVAGTIAAASNGTGTIGVAFGAALASYRWTFENDQIESFLRDAGRADVINNSWGTDVEFGNDFADPTFAGAAEALRAAVDAGREGLGTIVVFAAGNDRLDGMDTNYNNFTNSRYTISVAAIDDAGNNAFFSTPGASLLVAAPGQEITTTDRSGAAGASSGDYAEVQGTSFAAPIVSGVVALMLEANPLLGWRDVQEILAYSARQVDAADPGWGSNGARDWNGGGLHFSQDYGFGLVDAGAAVALAETWTRSGTSANEAALAVSYVPPGGTPRAIPENNPAGIVSSISIGQSFSIQHVELHLDIQHSWRGDLYASITSPSGATSVLMNKPGLGFDGGDDISFDFSSNAFMGEDAFGQWTVRVADIQPGDTGRLLGWRLTLHGDAASPDATYIYTDEFAIFGANTARHTLRDTDGGLDTVNAAAVTSDSLLDLSGAATSRIAGQVLSISPGVIERAYGGSGNDSVTGNSAANMLSGGSGDDRLAGAAGRDTLHGGSGNDTLDGGVHRDELHGGGGDDVLAGGEEADVVLGEAGNDRLLGGRDHDTLSGGTGLDRLEGDSGNDRLDGGPGNDLLIGGAGYDLFVFGRSAGDRDAIGDFRNGADHIELASFGLANYAAFRNAVCISATTDGVLLRFTGLDQEIAVSGYLPSQVTADDFVFT